MSSYHLEPRSPRASPVPLQFPITGGGGGSNAAADKKGQASTKSPYHAPQANAYPAPTQPAPPPPPRTVSKNAEPVPRYVYVCKLHIASEVNEERITEQVNMSVWDSMV